MLKKRRRHHWRRRRELDEFFRLNCRLNVAYMLEEQFDAVGRDKTQADMALALDRWRRMLRWQYISPLKRFWTMISFSCC